MFDKWIHVVSKINKIFEKCFEKWARFVYRNNIAVIIISLVVSLSLCVGFIRFKQQNDGTRLYIPQNSEAFQELDETEPFFDMYMFEMDFIIVSNKSNVISREVFNLIDAIQKDVGKIHTKSGLSLENRCFKSFSKGIRFPEKNVNFYNKGTKF